MRTMVGVLALCCPVVLWPVYRPGRAALTAPRRTPSWKSWSAGIAWLGK